MFRIRLKTAAALAGLGLLCGCTSLNPSPCGEQREGFFSRMMSGFHGRPKDQCECVETGRVTTVGEGPIVPEPCCGAPGCATQEFPSTGIPSTGFPSTDFPVTVPAVPNMPPPTALPLPNSGPFAPPTEAKPSSIIKNAAK